MQMQLAVADRKCHDDSEGPGWKTDADALHVSAVHRSLERCRHRPS